MDLRQLRYFLMVAEEGSVAAASRRLHIAQPALSRHIHALEDHIGAPLFERGPRGVSLTDAGNELIACASRVFDAMRDLDDRMATYKYGVSGDLHVGIAGSYSWIPILGKIFAKLRVISPGLRVHLRTQMSVEQLEDIRRSALDVGILTWRPSSDKELDGFTVFRDRWAVATPRAIAKKYQPGKHYLSDFREESFMMFPRARSPGTFDALSLLFLNAGFKPTINHTVGDLPTMMGLVSSGVACAIVPETFEKHSFGDVTIFPLMDDHTSFDLEIVWRAVNKSLLLSRFIETARLVLKEGENHY